MTSHIVSRMVRVIAACLVVLAPLLGWVGYRSMQAYWARTYLEAAQEALRRHEWDTAQQSVEASLRYRPNNPAAHLLAARIARRQERLADAEEALATAERLAGTQNHATKVERALLRVYRGDLAGAEEFLRTCIAEEDPDVVEILDVLSAALILKYRVAEARRCLDDLLKREPDHFHALVRRAWTARSAGTDTYAEAIDFFEKALALRPDADNVRLALAEMQVAVGRFDVAQKNFEQLRQRQPDNPSVLFGLGRALLGQGQLKDAQELFDRVLAVYPQDWKTLGERGWVAMQQRRPEEAEGYLRRALELAPPDLPLLTRMANCLRLLGKTEEERTFRARADRLTADLQRAERLGTQIREKTPQDPQPRYELACILLTLGKRTDALHWFHTALEKDASHRPTLQALVELHEKAGEFDRAAEYRRRLGPPEAPR